MPRYIDADKLTEEFEWIQSQKSRIYRAETEDVIERIRNAPTEDVAPVVHAHWDPYFEDFKITSNWTAKVKNGKCSNCKNETGEHIDTCKRFYKYCFNCGAKMDEEEG